MERKKIIGSKSSLSKNERLKSRKLIANVFREGKQLSVFPLKVVYARGSTGTVLQAGFSVSSKNFKRAVGRNRIKRLLRETYRVIKNDLMQSLEKKEKPLTIFIIYTGRELPEYQFIYEKMKILIQILTRKSNEADF